MTRQQRILALAVSFLAMGPLAWATTGGPDGFGYAFIDSNEVGNPNAPVFAFVPLVGGTDVPTGGGAALLADQDDAVSDAVNIGFTFTYYGTPYTQLTVDSNGYIQFTAPVTDFTSDAIPNAVNTPDEMICANWNDLGTFAPPNAGSIRTLLAGVAPNQTFTIEFLDYAHLGDTNPIRIQVVLSETSNDIVLQIDAATADGSQTSIGIEGPGGATGLQYALSSVAGIINNVAAQPCDNVAVLFTTRDVIPPAPVATLAASLPTGNTVRLDWTTTGDDGFVGTATITDIRWSLTPIVTQADFLAANQVTGEPVPAISGTPQFMVVPQLPVNSNIFFAIELIDDNGNNGQLSNVVNISTLAIDDGGYSAIDGTNPPGPTVPIFCLDALQGGTTIVLGDDVFSAPIALPFTFTFYGTPFNQVTICSNGFLSFPADTPSLSAQIIPNLNTPNGMCAFHWNDMLPGAATVTFAIAGTAPNRFFVVDFNGVNHFGGANPCQSRCYLLENGDIVMMEGAATSDGNSRTEVGIERGDGVVGYHYAESSVAGTFLANRAIRYTQNPANPLPDYQGPDRVTDLAGVAMSPTDVQLNWTESGDDCTTGIATTTDLRFSFANIANQVDFLNATPVIPAGAPVPTGGGNAAAFLVTGLPADTDVFFAVEYIDDQGFRSALSNVIMVHTIDNVAPSPVADLRVTNINGTFVTVTWTNTGDNLNVGTATTIDIRARINQGCLALTPADFMPGPPAGVTDYVGEPVPTAAGTTQSFTFDVGASFTTFSVGMMVFDEVPNPNPPNAGTVSNQPVCGVTGAPVWQPGIPGSDSGGGISNTAAYSVDPCMDVNPTTNQPGVVWTDRDTVGGDLEIFMRQSNGAAFAELALSGSGGGLSNNASPSQFSDIAYDVTGRAVVAWQDVDTANGDADIFVRRFDAGAWQELAGSATGSGVSQNNSSSTGPSVEINPLTGQPGVAWVDFSLGDFEIFFREFDPAAVPAPAWVQRANSGQNQGVSNNTGVSLQPSLAYDALGRPVIAWADNTSGNYEIYVRRFNPALFPPAWEELAGSGTGGGISLSPTQVSQNPSIQIGFGDNPFVVWQETLPTGNFEIYGRRFNGVNWVDFGPGSAVNGGISITPGRSITPELCMHPGFTDVFLCVWSDLSDPQGDWEIYGKWFDNGQWRELGATSARLGGISNTAGQSVSPCCGIANGATPVAFVSWQEFSGGNYEVFVRSLALIGPVADSNLEFVVGGGTGGRGQYRVFDNGTSVVPGPYAPLELRTAPFAAGYNANPGILHPACGDVDGDGLDEVILGQGPFPGGTGGFVAVMRDHTGRFDQLAMLRFPWTAYNNASGAVYPAAGDLDGDGRDEIVMGMGTFAGGGYFAVFDDQIGLFGFLRFVRAGFPSYNSLNGELHPACGDVDADGVDEIVVGMGRGGAGVATVRDDLLRNFAGLGYLTYPNSAYNSANGTTWPSCGNLTGGLGAETVIGPGKGGSGLLYIYGDRALGFTRVGGLQFPWSAYNTSSGEVRPAVGNLDPDLALEVVAGTGPFLRGPLNPNVFVFNNVTTGAGAVGTFVLYANTNANYNRNNGETFPATGQLR